MRIATKITRLLPTFTTLTNNSTEVHPAVILNHEDMFQIFKELEFLLSESEVLLPQEQDRVSAFVMNLELIIPLYRANEPIESGTEAIQLKGVRPRFSSMLKFKTVDWSVLIKTDTL